MTPPGCSSLYGEFAFKNRSKRWINQTIKQSMGTIKKLYGINPSDIATEKIISLPHAYVTYDQWREQHLPQLLNKLAEYDIYSVGRYGAWKYASMQEAVLDGKAVADQAIARLETKPFLVNIPSKTKHIRSRQLEQK
jgi:protoporphyrinogen oxidase